ncbi:MAG TPA: hypothetical protein VL598_16085 [Trinickia sp.]|jgi:hypothetical protein|uniref:hypothetical protein n=1 Tax=Trinickia sp. TaxID=2571163 RepID=UPI002C954840|nr:hypothetical protein [Trinickia sp.]HTI19170.1 hypothetical protein [Trinickia sp.]
MSDPVVNVTNHSTRDLFVDRDPNWDDQVLMVDGKRLKQVHRVRPDESVTVSVPMSPHDVGDEHMMGVIFADGKDYDYGGAGGYQLSIGQHSESGLLGVTDEYKLKRPGIEYMATNQTAWSMNIEFIDVPRF